MPNLPVWKGDTSTRLDPKCPIYDDGKDGPRYTLIYNGVYTTMRANIPARLSQMTDAPGAYLVDDVHLEQAPGNRGVMTVICTPVPIQDWTFPDNSVQELEWIEVQKPLKNHPVFNPVTEDSVHPNAGLYALSLDLNGNNTNDWIDIEFWENEPNPANKAQFMYSQGAGTWTLSANAQQYAMRVLKGQDSYTVYCPSARVTKKAVNQPDGTYCGFQADPPEPLKVDGYVYLQTASRFTHGRTWESVDEFTGFDEIDDIIYPSDGGS